MKTIEERARERVENEIGVGIHPDEHCFLEEAFIAGAKSEHALLTEWNSPDEKLPAPGVAVLLKLQSQYKQIIRYTVVCRSVYGEWDFRDTSLELAIMEGNYDITGWREIHE